MTFYLNIALPSSFHCCLNFFLFKWKFSPLNFTQMRKLGINLHCSEKTCIITTAIILSLNFHLPEWLAENFHIKTHQKDSATISLVNFHILLYSILKCSKIIKKRSLRIAAMNRAIKSSIVIFIVATIYSNSNKKMAVNGAKITVEQMQQATEPVRMVCIQKSKVSEESLENMRAGKLNEDEKELKCYVNCVMEMMQMVSNWWSTSVWVDIQK